MLAVGLPLPIKGLLEAPVELGASPPLYLPVGALVTGLGEPGHGLRATAVSPSIRAFAHLREARPYQEEPARCESLEREEVLDVEDRRQGDLTASLPLRDAVGGRHAAEGILTTGTRRTAPTRALRREAAGCGRALKGCRFVGPAEGLRMEPSSLIEVGICRRSLDCKRNSVGVARTILAGGEDRLIPGGAVGGSPRRRSGGRRAEIERNAGLDL